MGLMSEPTTQELALQIAVLEERMNTRQAEYKTDLATYAADTRAALDRMNHDIAKHGADIAKHGADMAKHGADMAKRETRLIAVLLGGIGVATAILGAFISMN